MDAPPQKPDEAVARLAELPGVAEAIERAREACTALRWHEGLRRRTREAAAESRIRGAAASAALEGAEPAGSARSVDLVRDLVRGATSWSDRPDDPVWKVLAGAVRATAATEHVAAVDLRAPAQLLARLHTAAMADVLPSSQVGRPRLEGEGSTGGDVLGPAPEAADARHRMSVVDELIRRVPDGRVPALLVAGVVHAEIAVARPFVAGNGIVARALERVLLRVSALDPTGVAVPEVGHADRAGTDYRGALRAYADSRAGGEGVGLWLMHCATATERAAAEGVRVADAVRAGRLPGSG